MLNIGWLIFIAVSVSVAALLLVPRLFGAITRRSPWSPSLLQRVDVTLKHWSTVLGHDWAALLGRVREISCDTAERNGSQQFVLGGLALLIAPVVIVLNAVILAQILEIFLPGSTEMLSIPYLGNFMPFPFIAAIIIAGVEVIAAIACWHSPHLAWRLLAGCVALVAIVAETTGGYIRARVMEGADELALVGSNGILDAQTAWVSALISFLAPMAEMIAGVLLFEGLLVPLGYHVLRIVRIVPLWLLRGGGYLFYGPFLSEEYLSEPEMDITTPIEEIVLPAETQQSQPLIHEIVIAAKSVAHSMVDEAITLKTEAHALDNALLGLSGTIANFLATKVKHGPQHIVEVHPGAIIAEFANTLDEARSQPVFQECQNLIRESAPRNPAQVYRGYSREMLLEEAEALDRKRTRLQLLVRQMVLQAQEMALMQLTRIQQTDAFLWMQDPQAKREWEIIQALKCKLEEGALLVERRLLHTITQRQETLQGLNDLVASPLLSEMRERTREENLRQMKMIVTRLGCDPVREGFAALAGIFADVTVDSAAAVDATQTALSAFCSRSREIIDQAFPAIAVNDSADLLQGREAVHMLLERASTELAGCHTRLEQTAARMHEVTDHLVEVRCLECPETLCVVCPRCEHFQLTIQTQASEVNEDCTGFERLLNMRAGQLQRLAKRKTLWGRLFAWVDDWREGDDVKKSWQEVKR